MNREWRVIAAILAGTAVLVVAVMALLGGSKETTVLPVVDLPPPGTEGPGGTPIAVVVSTREDVETSWFGLRKGETHYVVSVQFYAPPGCTATLAEDADWPTTDAVCATDVPISGTVSGSGTASTGESIVLVDTEVGAACFATLAPNDRWPPAASACP